MTEEYMRTQILLYQGFVGRVLNSVEIETFEGRIEECEKEIEGRFGLRAVDLVILVAEIAQVSVWYLPFATGKFFDVGIKCLENSLPLSKEDSELAKSLIVAKSDFVTTSERAQLQKLLDKIYPPSQLLRLPSDVMKLILFELKPPQLRQFCPLAKEISRVCEDEQFRKEYEKIHPFAFFRRGTSKKLREYDSTIYFRYEKYSYEVNVIAQKYENDDEYTFMLMMELEGRDVGALTIYDGEISKDPHKYFPILAKVSGISNSDPNQKRKIINAILNVEYINHPLLSLV
jgi:hypothetical protein